MSSWYGCLFIYLYDKCIEWSHVQHRIKFHHRLPVGILAISISCGHITFYVIIKCDHFLISKISFIVIVQIWNRHSFSFLCLYETKTGIKTKCAWINLMSFSVDRLRGVTICSTKLCQYKWDWYFQKFFC
jgi:hypothetical protein